MTDSDITTTILRQIRDEIITTRTELKTELEGVKTELKDELGGVKAELAGVNVKLELTNERLSLVEHTVRDFAGQVVILARYVKNKHDVEIERLAKRVARLEKKVG